MKKKHRRRLPMFWGLMAAILACSLLLLTTTLAVTMHYTLDSHRQQLDGILMSTVKTLAEAPEIRRILQVGKCNQEAADYLLSVVRNTEDLEYITIADTNSIRVYHVYPNFIGLPFDGNDQHRALEGEVYLSDAEPINFEAQRRAFHPVRDEQEQILGFVMASATHTRIDQLSKDIYLTYFRLFLMLTVCSLILCAVLGMYLGKNLRGVKPDDLLRVYLTQNDILNALDEGLVSFDNAGRVRLVNTAAARMLGHREDLLVGQQVDDLLRAKDGSSLRNRESGALQSDRANILVQPVQLPDSNLWARQVLILADKSEVTRYAEELVGTRHILSALRANTHEFLNKLQVISGLIQMGHVDSALQYIGSMATIHEHIIGPVMKLIRNSNVAALILAKEGNMRELDIDLFLMSNSGLPERSRYLSTRELVTVVGNLLENAMEAINALAAGENRSVALQITEDAKGLLIMVSDTGEGIADRDLPRIFESGFSTKAASGRGVGMNLVKEIVDRHGGSIDVDTEPGSGTTITIIFSRERGENV